MENAFVDWLRDRLPTLSRQSVGLGDDAAVLDWPTGKSPVVTVDLLTEGVDFRLAEHSPRRIGRKSLAVNLSDIAAMAARPVAAFVALALPRTGAAELARELYEGMLPLAENYGVALAGGDTNLWDSGLVISVTVIGEPADTRLLRRNGARPGDRVLVTGSLGGSILGHHFDFEPRIEESILLNERYQLSAGMDISDGLSLDLSRLAAESGCGAVLELDKIPISNAARQLTKERADGVSPLEHALSDGEDFELLLTAPPEVAARIIAEQPLNGVPVTEVGCIVESHGLWQQDVSGRREPMTPRGWEHGGRIQARELRGGGREQSGGNRRGGEPGI